MSQAELLKKTISALEAGSTPYMLTGSFAPNRRDLDQYGEQARRLHEIDALASDGLILTPRAGVG